MRWNDKNICPQDWLILDHQKSWCWAINGHASQITKATTLPQTSGARDLGATIRYTNKPQVDLYRRRLQLG